MPPRSPQGSHQPTLQDLADRTGFARSTISLALRNDPSLPKPTRDLIHQTAREIGYRPNPLVAALMAQIRGKRRQKAETIAIIGLSQTPFKALLETSSFYRVLYDGIVSRAAELNLSVDVIDIFSESFSGTRATKILKTRGIHGVLLFPRRETETAPPQIAWEHFAAVEIGFHWRSSLFHQVVSDYTHDIDLAISKVKQAGIERLGFAVPPTRDMKIDYGWSSRFLLYQHPLPASRKVPFIKCKGADFTREEFLSWIERHQPEAILVAGRQEHDWLIEEITVNKARNSRLRLPKIVNLVQRDETGLAGIDPRTVKVGGAAVELLMSLLATNQMGLPSVSQMVAIKGAWVNGESFPTV